MPAAAALFTRPPASDNTIQYNTIIYLFIIYFRYSRGLIDNQAIVAWLFRFITYFRYSRDHLQVTSVRMERARSRARKMPSIRSQSSSVDTGAGGVTTASLAARPSHSTYPMGNKYIHTNA